MGATRLYYVMAPEKCVSRVSSGAWKTKRQVSPGKKLLRALNIETGKVVWEIPQTGPVEGKRWAGVLGTAGHLLFYADPMGDLVAVDEVDGKPLWHIPTNTKSSTLPSLTPPAGISTSLSLPARIFYPSGYRDDRQPRKTGGWALKRRTLLTSLCAGGAWAVLEGEPVLPGAAEQARRFRIWDAHSHLHAAPGATPEERMEVLIRCADRLGIERLILSQGYSSDLHPTPAGLREENDRVMRAVRRFPERAYGSVYLSPSFLDFSLEEFDRCVRDGPMVGVGELEADKRCNAPELDAIVERAISMKSPILQHTWLKLDGNEPGESTPYDLVELAKRHPAANFICAHTGGDWERGIRIIRDTRNISAEIAGFDPTSGVLEMAVRELGPERVIYGSDVAGRSFASQLAKVIGAAIPESAKELVLGGNLRRLLTPILRAKGYQA